MKILGFIFLVIGCPLGIVLQPLYIHYVKAIPVTSSQQLQWEQEFLEQARLYNKQLPPYLFLEGTGLNDNSCVPKALGGKKVVYVKADANKRVVFHELGHCLLNLSHSSELKENGFPRSWMMQKRDEETEAHMTQKEHEAEYIRELFTRSNQISYPGDFRSLVDYGVTAFAEQRISRKAFDYYLPVLGFGLFLGILSLVAIFVILLMLGTKVWKLNKSRQTQVKQV